MSLTSYQQGILKKIKNIHNDGKSPCYVFYVFKKKNILIYKLEFAESGLINFFWNRARIFINNRFSILCAFEMNLDFLDDNIWKVIFSKICFDNINFMGYPSLFGNSRNSLLSKDFKYTLNSIPRIRKVLSIDKLDIKYIYGYDEENFIRILYNDLILAIKKLYFFKFDKLCDDLKISILDELNFL